MVGNAGHIGIPGPGIWEIEHSQKLNLSAYEPRFQGKYYCWQFVFWVCVEIGGKSSGLINRV